MCSWQPLLKILLCFFHFSGTFFHDLASALPLGQSLLFFTSFDLTVVLTVSHGFKMLGR